MPTLNFVHRLDNLDHRPKDFPPFPSLLTLRNRLTGRPRRRGQTAFPLSLSASSGGESNIAPRHLGNFGHPQNLFPWFGPRRAVRGIKPTPHRGAVWGSPEKMRRCGVCHAFLPYPIGPHRAEFLYRRGRWVLRTIDVGGRLTAPKPVLGISSRSINTASSRAIRLGSRYASLAGKNTRFVNWSNRLCACSICPSESCRGSSTGSSPNLVMVSTARPWC